MKNSISPDCKELQLSAQYINGWLKKQKNVKEESLTDHLLFDISERIPKITYKAFSRNEEAKISGADWEWAYVFDDFTLRMRVQAKKVIKANNYSSIAYANQHGLQIEKLIENSSEHNTIPLYAFYTPEEGRTACRLQNEEPNSFDCGVYIAGAKTIWNEFIRSGIRKVTPQEILSKSIPLSCLLCCPIIDNRDGDFSKKKRFVEFFKSYFPTEVIQQNTHVSNVDEIVGFERRTPTHISILLDKKDTPIEDWYEKEYHRALDGINAIMIYDGRSQ